jgi:hypothetical protein
MSTIRRCHVIYTNKVGALFVIATVQVVSHGLIRPIAHNNVVVRVSQ